MSMRFTASAIILFTAFACVAAARPAWAVVPEGLQVSRQGDSDLDCSQIAGEIETLDDLIRETYETRKTSDEASLGVGVVKTVGSFLVGTLTGTLGFMAAGHLAAEAADSRGESAEAVGDTALQRRSLMVGMHQVKKCEGALPEPPPPPEKFWRSLKNPENVEPAAGEGGGESGASAGDNTPPRPAMPHETKRYND